MKCSKCGTEVKGKFCPECGTSQEATAQQAPTTDRTSGKSVKKTLWLIPATVLLLTIALVLWQFFVANSAAASYQQAQKQLPQAEQVLTDAQDASDSATGELESVLACNDYFGSDCSWVYGKSLGEMESEASAAKSVVAEASNEVDNLKKTATEAKQQVSSSNQAMILIAGIGIGLVIVSAVIIFALKRRSKKLSQLDEDHTPGD